MACVPVVSQRAQTASVKERGQVASRPLTCGNNLEPVTGIEPACPAWEAGALPLSYTGMLARKPCLLYTSHR